MTTFTAYQIQAKASKAGKTYWEIETNQGKATCFDYPIVQEIEKNLNRPISLYEIETNEKGFSNIRKANGFSKPMQQQQQNPQASQPVIPQAMLQANPFEEARKSKDVSMFTSYAKDIFLALLEKETETKELDFKAMMKDAVELIKQAKVSFERNEIFTEAKAKSANEPTIAGTFQG
jgi:hypothetical protein